MKKIIIDDKEYPEKLRNIQNPPEELYVLGNETILNEACIAIVGSRVCTEKGAIIAEQFSSKLTKLGINIISGMAVRNRC